MQNSASKFESAPSLRDNVSSAFTHLYATMGPGPRSPFPGCVYVGEKCPRSPKVWGEAGNTTVADGRTPFSSYPYVFCDRASRIDLLRGPASASFCSITCSQKEAIASQDLSLTIIPATTVCSDRSSSISSFRTRRSPSHAGHSSRMCCAVSLSLSQWWHLIVGSLLALCAGNLRSSHAPRPPAPTGT